MLFSCSPAIRGPANLEPNSLYSSSYGSFSFLAPPKPAYQSIQQGTDPAYRMTVYNYTYSWDKYNIEVAYYKISYPPLNIENEDNLLLDNMVGGAAKNSASEIVETNSITYKGYPGREFILSQGMTYQKVRLYLLDREVFFIGITYPKELNNSSTFISKFLESFYKDVTPKVGSSSNNAVAPEKINKFFDSQDLIKILRSNLDFLDIFLAKRSWKKSSEFDKLKMIGGSEYHSYNYYLETPNKLFQILIIPNRIVMYYPNDSVFNLLSKEIKAKYKSIGTTTMYGNTTFDYQGNLEKFGLLRSGNNSINTITIYHSPPETKN